MEGVRRLSLVVGVIGGIAGCFLSFMVWQELVQQKQSYSKYQAMASPHSRGNKIFDPAGSLLGYESANPNPIVKITDSEGRVLHARSDLTVVMADPDFQKLSTDEKKKVLSRLRWIAFDRDGNPLDDQGELIARVDPPSVVSYTLMIFVAPGIGFLLPWTIVRTIGWVVAGFLADRKAR